MATATALLENRKSQIRNHQSPMPSIIIKPTFSIAGEIETQKFQIDQKQYRIIGKLLSVHFEGRRDIRGLSQSRSLGGDSFCEKRRQLWSSCTLDWLHYRKAPDFAVGLIGGNYLLPNGLTPLPDIPHPEFVATKAGMICPRIPQSLCGCPIVGDRVCGKIKDKRGVEWLVIYPVTQLALMLYAGGGGFGMVRGYADRATGTHPAFLINPETSEGYFVGGVLGAG